ncbi:MAG: hypothetical protein AVDCRST_MAG34-631, partial [uncultured Nocardioidaceae bacterium]
EGSGTWSDQADRPGVGRLAARCRRDRGPDPARPRPHHALRRAGDPLAAVRVGRAAHAPGGGARQEGRRGERADLATDPGVDARCVGDHRARRALGGQAVGPGLVAAAGRVLAARGTGDRPDPGRLGVHRPGAGGVQLPDLSEWL